jgi:hypothetical protein
MDEIDIATELIERRLNDKLCEVRERKPEAIANGTCLLRACGEELPPGHRWCNAECRDMWERERKS